MTHNDEVQAVTDPLAALGIGVADRESRYDALPGVVRGLLALYDRAVVARWLRAWWLSTGEQKCLAIPVIVQESVGVDALKSAEVRAARIAHRDRRRVKRAKARRKPHKGTT